MEAVDVYREEKMKEEEPHGDVGVLFLSVENATRQKRFATFGLFACRCFGLTYFILIHLGEEAS